MKNLARLSPSPEQIAEINQDVLEELRIAGIFPISNKPDERGEVPAEFGGVYKGFKFRRLWYYWSVEGFVPLNVAMEIYNHPIGKRDVRAKGDCGCPSPEECYSEYDIVSNRQVVSDDEWNDGLKVLETLPKSLAAWKRDYMPVSEESDILLGCAKFIPSYHIDSQEGLTLFMNTIQKHKVTGYLT